MLWMVVNVLNRSHESMSLGNHQIHVMIELKPHVTFPLSLLVEAGT